MKNIFTPGLFIIIFFSAVFAEEITKKYDFKDFEEINVSSGMHIFIKQSDTYSIEVKAEENVFKYLKVDKTGDALRFYIDKSNFRNKGEIEINVSLPRLTALNLSGGSIGELSDMDIASENFNSSLSGGAQLNGELSCGDINLQLSGGSRVSLKGKGKDANIAGSGGSIFELKNFKVEDTDAVLSGGSEVKITMNGTLNTAQSGGSQLFYYGDAKVGNSALSGGSQVESGD